MLGWIFQQRRLDCPLRARQSVAKPCRIPCRRRIIAEAVAGNPDTYTEGFLGKPNGEYCAWIRDSQRWGGGIELSILSECAADYYHDLLLISTFAGYLRIVLEWQGVKVHAHHSCASASL